MKKIVYLDDERSTPDGFDTRVFTFEEAKLLIDADQVLFISLDNDLGDGNIEGYKVADYLEQLYFIDGKFIEFHPHTNNPSAFNRIMQTKNKIYQDYIKKGGKVKYK